MKNKFVLGFVMISIVALLSSCAKVPQAEIDAANAAIEEARGAAADVYVPAEFAALQDSMNSINAMVEAQKGKLFGSFTAVKEKLAAVTTQAATVKTNAETRKAEVQAEIETLLTEVTALVGQNKELVGKAPRGKEGAAAVEAIKTEIGVIETTVTEATGLRDSGNLVGALDKLKAAKEKATAINTELQDVIAKKAGVRK